MSRIREVFADMAPSSRPPAEITTEHHYKTITVLFPAVRPEDAPDVIDGLHRELKPDYVRDGFMIGEFHPVCPSPGLHNRDFRPLQAPVPMLVIRHITKWDAPFMTGSNAYIAAYLAHFGDEGRRRMAALADAKSTLFPADHKDAIRRAMDQFAAQVVGHVAGQMADERAHAAGTASLTARSAGVAGRSMTSSP